MPLLVRSQQALDVPTIHWYKALELALNNGWEPMFRLLQLAAGPQGFGTAGRQDGDSNDETGDEIESIIAAIDRAPELRPWWAVPPSLAAYEANCLSFVHAKDARGIAKALTSVLPDIPNHDAMKGKRFEAPDAAGQWVIKPGVTFNLFEFFSGDRKRFLRGLIAFLEKGECQWLKERDKDNDASA
jgi:hypothetical protein